MEKTLNYQPIEDMELIDYDHYECEEATGVDQALVFYCLDAHEFEYEIILPICTN